MTRTEDLPNRRTDDALRELLSAESVRSSVANLKLFFAFERLFAGYKP